MLEPDWKQRLRIESGTEIEARRTQRSKHGMGRLCTTLIIEVFGKSGFIRPHAGAFHIVQAVAGTASQALPQCNDLLNHGAWAKGLENPSPRIFINESPEKKVPFDPEPAIPGSPGKRKHGFIRTASLYILP